MSKENPYNQSKFADENSSLENISTSKDEAAQITSDLEKNKVSRLGQEKEQKDDKNIETMELKEYLNKKVYPFFHITEEDERIQIEQIENDPEIKSQNIRNIMKNSFLNTRRYIERRFQLKEASLHNKWSWEQIWSVIKNYYEDKIKDSCFVKRNMKLKDLENILNEGFLLPSSSIAEKNSTFPQRFEDLKSTERFLGFNEDEQIGHYTFRSNKYDLDKLCTDGPYLYGLLEVSIKPNMVEKRSSCTNFDTGVIVDNISYDVDKYNVDYFVKKSNYGYLHFSLIHAPIVRTFEDITYHFNSIISNKDFTQLEKISAFEALEVQIIGKIDLAKEVEKIDFLTPRDWEEMENILHAIHTIYTKYPQYWHLVDEGWKKIYATEYSK